MKACFVVHSLAMGGAERVVAGLAEYWLGKGWNISVISLASDLDDVYALPEGVQRVALDVASTSRNRYSGLKNNLRRVRALRAQFKRTCPEVVISFTPRVNVLSVLAQWSLNIPVIILSERTHPPSFPIGKYWEKLRQWSYPSAKTVVCQTNTSLRWLEKNIPSATGVVIPNPVQFPLPVSGPPLDYDQLVGQDQKVLLGAGRLIKGKGFEGLIECFSRLTGRFPNWRLVILGEGDLRSDLERKVSQLGLQGLVYLPGRAGNIGDWYRKADLFVLSSSFEGFPNVLVEALSHGCPAVSFDCEAGPADIIRSDVNGVLVNSGDFAALETALAQLMSNPVLAKQLSDRAIEIREHLSISRVAQMWEDLLAENLQ